MNLFNIFVDIVRLLEMTIFKENFFASYCKNVRTHYYVSFYFFVATNWLTLMLYWYWFLNGRHGSSSTKTWVRVQTEGHKVIDKMHSSQLSHFTSCRRLYGPTFKSLYSKGGGWNLCTLFHSFQVDLKDITIKQKIIYHLFRIKPRVAPDDIHCHWNVRGFSGTNRTSEIDKSTGMFSHTSSKYDKKCS